MAKSLLGFLFLTCLYYQSVMGRFVVEKNNLTVSSPDRKRGIMIVRSGTSGFRSTVVVWPVRCRIYIY
ncbi:hypothetical protein Hanom_Chr06g00579161 [Helianthus anomalus]